MAAKVLFLDSEKHYSTAALAAQKFATLADPNTTWTREATGGPTNGPHLKRASNNSSAGLLDYIIPRMARTQSGAWTPTSAGLLGFSLKIDDLSEIDNGDANRERIISIWQDSTEMLRINCSNGGAISIYRVNNAISFTLLGLSGAGVIQSGQWHHCQLRYDLRNSNGRVAFRVDRTTYADSGLTDTLGAGTLPNQIRMIPLKQRELSTGLIVRISDIFLFSLDAYADLVQGAYEWLDGALVGCRFPTADGFQNQWDADPNGDHFDNVKETTPDDDATIVETETAGLRELYPLDPVVDDPIAQQAVAYGKREAASGAGLAFSTRHGGSTVDEVDQGLNDAAYAYVLHPMDVNAVTGDAETVATANASEYGFAKA